MLEKIVNKRPDTTELLIQIKSDFLPSDIIDQ